MRTTVGGLSSQFLAFHIQQWSLTANCVTQYTIEPAFKHWLRNVLIDPDYALVPFLDSATIAFLDLQDPSGYSKCRRQDSEEIKKRANRWPIQKDYLPPSNPILDVTNPLQMCDFSEVSPPDLGETITTTTPIERSITSITYFTSLSRLQF